MIAKFLVEIAHIDNASDNLLERVEDKLVQLKNLYSEKTCVSFNDEDLAWIVFVDRCSLLYFMEKLDNFSMKKLELKFHPVTHRLNFVREPTTDKATSIIGAIVERGI